MQSQWMISFRANYSNQLTCIPFAVTNKTLPVKGLAKDPINKLIFLQFKLMVADAKNGIDTGRGGEWM